MVLSWNDEHKLAAVGQLIMDLFRKKGVKSLQYHSRAVLSLLERSFNLEVSTKGMDSNSSDMSFI